MALESESDDHLIERRDGLRADMAAMRRELKAHIDEEMPLMRSMLQELGSPDQVRERRVFIEIWIRREQRRDQLRTAIIEKGLLLAVLALFVWVGQAIWNELGAALRLLLGKH